MKYFEDSALKILGESEIAQPVARTLAAIDALLRDKSWQGACHASTAIAFVLLREQGVAALPCLGEIMMGNIASDHSWIELDREPFDVAISLPIPPAPVVSAVIAGRELDTGDPTPILYGAVSGEPTMPDAAAIKRMTIGAYMSGFPDHPDGLWGVARDLAISIGVSVDAGELRGRYMNARWELRPVPDRRRERNRRKRARQGR
jgi:hypothetical protein